MRGILCQVPFACAESVSRLRPALLRRRSVQAMGAAPAQSATVVIRLAERHDAADLHPIIHSAYRTDASWTTEVNLVAGERVSLAQLQRELDSSPDPTFVATVADETGKRRVVGCIRAEWAKQNPGMELGDECAMFGLFAVDPAFQSKGVGSQLFRHAMQHAKEEWGCTEAVVWVIKQRAEILAWYERWGFAWDGEVKDFVFPDLKLQDDVEFRVLRKQLK